MGVAPRARDASSYSFGTASSAVMDTLMMEGSIALVLFLFIMLINAALNFFLKRDKEG